MTTVAPLAPLLWTGGITRGRAERGKDLYVTGLAVGRDEPDIFPDPKPKARTHPPAGSQVIPRECPSKSPMISGKVFAVTRRGICRTQTIQPLGEGAPE